MSSDRPRCEFAEEDLRLRLELNIPGSLEAIPGAVEQIMGLVAELGCAAGSEFEIEVALNEALANAIKHGCRLDASKQVEVQVACDPARGVLIIVRDPGPGFAIDGIPNPVVGERLFFSHGRGIFLINRLMDEVRYERNGAEIWMRKGPNGAGSPDAESGTA